MSNDRYAFILKAVSRAETADEIKETFLLLREVYGISNIVYHAVRIPGIETDYPILLLTYDPQWISLYLERDYFKIDPVIKAGRSNFLPLDWQDIDRSSSDTRLFFAKAESFGVGRNGISMPIRGANGERAIFTITSNVSEREWNAKRIGYLRDFQVIGNYVHDQALKVTGLRPPELKRRPSNREIQCLKAFSKGRTPKQIAADLHISESAVRLYLHSIRAKLDCATITQAVCAAINQNFIES